MAARQVMRIQFTPNKKIRVIFYERASRFRAVYSRAGPLTGANVLTRDIRLSANPLGVDSEDEIHSTLWL